MVNAAASAAGFVDLLAGVIALEIFFLLDPQSAGAGTTTTPSPQTPLLDTAALGLLVPLGAAGALFTAAAVIYHRMSRAAVPVTGAAAAIRQLRLSEVVVFIMCVAAGVLDFFFFVRPAGGGGAEDHGAQAARALGMAAHRALPAAATVAFFWGMMLIIIAHVRAGGEGGGGAIAGAGRGANQLGPIRLLTNIAFGAAAGLFLLVTTAFCVRY